MSVRDLNLVPWLGLDLHQMADRGMNAGDNSQRLLSQIVSQIEVLSSSLNGNSAQQPSSSLQQPGHITVEEEVASVFNRSRPRPISTNGGVGPASVQANPMHAMRRNFQQLQANRRRMYVCMFKFTTKLKIYNLKILQSN